MIWLLRIATRLITDYSDDEKRRKLSKGVLLWLMHTYRMWPNSINSSLSTLDIEEFNN